MKYYNFINSIALAFLVSGCSNLDESALGEILTATLGAAAYNKADTTEEKDKVLKTMGYDQQTRSALLPSAPKATSTTAYSSSSPISSRQKDLFQKFPSATATNCVSIRSAKGSSISSRVFYNSCNYPVHVVRNFTPCKYSPLKDNPFKGVYSRGCSGGFSLSKNGGTSPLISSSGERVNYIACKRISVNDYSPHYTSSSQNTYSCFKAVY